MSEPFLFVSHVSEDRSPAAELVAELERRGVQCWIAPRNVRPGKPYDDEIAEAIDDCAAMLLIFSERCNESHYIRREITVAGEAQKLIIPFRIEDAQPKRGLRIRLADLHWIDGFIAREQAIETLIRSVADDGTAHRSGAVGASTSDPAPAVAGEPRTTVAENAPSQMPTMESGETETVAPLAPAMGESAEDPIVDDDVEEWSEEDRQRLKRAQEGDAQSQHWLACRYEEFKADPRGKIPQNHKRSVYWAAKAAAQGYAPAHALLARIYSGRHTPLYDDVKGFHHALKAAEAGDRHWQHDVGYFLEKGMGVEKDLARAMTWYRTSADSGNRYSQVAVGRFYERGLGVERDHKAAFEWYHKAALQYTFTENEGCAALGRFYESGLGVERDYQQAADWYARSLPADWYARPGDAAEAKAALKRLKERHGIAPSVAAPAST